MFIEPTLAHLDPVEARIIAALTMVALKRNDRTKLGVLKETGWLQEPTDKLHLVRAAIGRAETTRLVFTDGHRRLGDIVLAHGRGVDVIADVQPTVEKVAGPILRGFVDHALEYGYRRHRERA